MFLKGISNLEECPLNRNIPVFVLVGGAIASLKLLQVLWKQYSRRREPAEEETTDTHSGSVEFIFIYYPTYVLFINDNNSLLRFLYSRD